MNPPLKTSMAGPEPEAVLPPPTQPPPPPLPGPAGAHAGLGRVSPSASLDCPRCDQDLRAEPMGWTISCPLEGRCPECGLSFRWADQLSRRHALPRWCLEGAAGARDWFRRWPGQVAMAIGRPGQVHRRLRLEHRRRPWSLAAALLPFVVLFAVIPMAETAWRSWQAGMTPGLVARDALQPWRSSPSVVFVPVGQVTTPGRAWIHSASVLGGWWETGDDLIRAAPRHAPDELESLRTTPRKLIRVPLTGGVVVGLVTDGTGAVPPAMVRTLQGPVSVPLTGPTPWWQTITWGGRFLSVGMPIIGVPLLAAAAFVLLPVVRRRARVAPGHIVRLMLLGLLLAVPLALAATTLSTVRGWRFGGWLLRGLATSGSGGVDERMATMLGIPVACAALLTFIWIRSAAVHHLRLPRASAVAAACTAVAITGVVSLWFVAMVAA